MKLFTAIATAAVITCFLGNEIPAKAQNAIRFDPASWQQAVDECSAYDRIQFKSEMIQEIINGLRAYEQGN